MSRQAYSTDLKESEWKILEGLLPRRFSYGRPAKWALRELVNAMLYELRTGCHWHLVPHDFPPYKTVFEYYRQRQRVMGTGQHGAA